MWICSTGLASAAKMVGMQQRRGPVTPDGMRDAIAYVRCTMADDLDGKTVILEHADTRELCGSLATLVLAGLTEAHIPADHFLDQVLAMVDRLFEGPGGPDGAR